jgi:hypothetical protein
MKKFLFLLAVLSTLLVACNPQQSNIIPAEGNDGNNYGIVVIDECQYVRGFESLAHKGNCTNLVHWQIYVIDGTEDLGEDEGTIPKRKESRNRFNLARVP